MEIILMFLVGCIVFIIAVVGIVKGVIARFKSPFDDLKEEVLNLKTRVNDLENEKKL